MAYENGYICRYYEADSHGLRGANIIEEMEVFDYIFQDIMSEKSMENGVN